ncbi:hypothetical protein MNBD_GAMMA12-1498 [hydrothermal vent metagenome]|uniref:Uncharacterized protein n=1 Tax=hydrothermal vent metagenome TaxID=652676 RepID=A0A3B0YK03_9ZZZZ
MGVVMNPDDSIVSDEKDFTDKVERTSTHNSNDPGVSTFIPAYYDTQTDTVYLSRYKNGSVAPVHVLDSIPKELLSQSAANKSSTNNDELSQKVIVGFVFNNKFYTRAEALEAWNKLAEQDAQSNAL